MGFMTITPELGLQIRILSYIDDSYVSDIVIALYETINGIKQSPEDMPIPVRDVYIYWISEGRLQELKRGS